MAILTKTVIVTPIAAQFERYKKLGYKPKNQYDKIEVLVEHLPKGSTARIDIECTDCDKILNIFYYQLTHIEKNKLYHEYRCRLCANKIVLRDGNLPANNPEVAARAQKTREKTSMDRWGVKYTMQLPWVVQKQGDTNYAKHGFRNVFQVPEIQAKSKKTLNDKYDVDNAADISEVKAKKRKTSEENGVWLPIHMKSAWSKFRMDCERFTNKAEKIIFDLWDGYDYYDGEYILEYRKLPHTDPKYPTMDHKISLFDGFKQGISAEIIGNIDNLCITKRGINASKSRRSEKEFKKFLKDEKKKAAELKKQSKKSKK